MASSETGMESAKEGPGATLDELGILSGELTGRLEAMGRGRGEGRALWLRLGQWAGGGRRAWLA